MKFNLHRSRPFSVLCLCVLLSAVVLAHTFNFGLFLGPGGLHAQGATIPSGGLASFTEVRVYGSTISYCQEGVMGAGSVAGWCRGSADWSGVSGAHQIDPGIHCGPFDAGVRHWIDGSLVRQSTTLEFFSCGECPDCDQQSPIIIDTSRNPNDRYALTSARNGVLFDIDADGDLDQVAWVANGNRVAFLAIDRNSNGLIDDGSELFGNFTVPGAANGFLALAKLEAHNGDAKIDADDSLFAKLLLWHDRNRNGISEPSELSAASSELQAIGLGYSISDRTDNKGNRYFWQGWARQLAPGEDGKRIRKRDELRMDDAAREFVIYDVLLSGSERKPRARP